MKRLIIIWIVVCAAIGARAQGLQVESFLLLPNDLTAMSHGTERMDQNGERAALIRIVTPERGFVFDGGSLGIVGSEEHEGELWLYVPGYAQKLTISHRSFGVLRNYVYSIAIEPGRTYEMRLDMGTGRYVSITAPVAGTEVTIDDQYIGHAPLYNQYLHFGPHTISGVSGRQEGILTIDITQDTKRGAVLSIPMQDMSFMYGDVLVKVDDSRADILFQGRKVGVGSWSTQLKEGTYSVVTSRADCEPSRTSFIVKGRQKNEIKADAPIPHTGYLDIYTRPRNVIAILNGATPVDFTEPVPLPVGRHEVQFTRKGYVNQTHEYDVVRNQSTRDTVTLERVQYVKKLAFYFGGGYSISQLSGISAIVGAVFQRHDVQLSYTFGMQQSDMVNWYNDNGIWQCAMGYKLSSIAFKYGYQVNLLRQLGITPQVGASYDLLQGNAEEGSGNYADGAKACCLTLGLKLVLAPMQHCYLFAAPEYAVPLSQQAYFKRTAEKGGFETGGFGVTAGLLLTF